MNLPQQQLNTIITNVINNFSNCYNQEYLKLSSLSGIPNSGGQIREQSGELVESLLQSIFDTINNNVPNISIDSKKGVDDCLQLSISYKNQTYNLQKIQVDRHVFNNNKRICFIENKTYLDSCYFDRALSDFKKIIYSLSTQNIDPSQFLYIVFAGQEAAKQNTLLTYEVIFQNEIKHLTPNNNGVDMQIFYFLQDKRKSNKPWSSNQFLINQPAISDFVKTIIGRL